MGAAAKKARQQVRSRAEAGLAAAGAIPPLHLPPVDTPHAGDVIEVRSTGYTPSMHHHHGCRYLGMPYQMERDYWPQSSSFVLCKHKDRQRCGGKLVMAVIFQHYDTCVQAYYNGSMPGASVEVVMQASPALQGPASAMYCHNVACTLDHQPSLAAPVPLNRALFFQKR